MGRVKEKWKQKPLAVWRACRCAYDWHIDASAKRQAVKSFGHRYAHNLAIVARIYRAIRERGMRPDHAAALRRRHRVCRRQDIRAIEFHVTLRRHLRNDQVAPFIEENHP